MKMREYIFPIFMIIAILGSVFGTAILAEFYFLN
jgi:hypothetical protein